jgi:peptidoglycan-associated lipoprotein
MRNYLIASGLIAVLLTGCSQKSVEIETTKTSSQDGSESGSDYTQKEGTTVTDLTSGIISEVDLSRESQNVYDKELNPDGSIKSVFFDFDQFSIRGDMQEIVVNNTNYFNKAQNQTYKIKIEGNCDEWGTDEYNYALGLKRAKSVKDSLIVNGIDSSRVTLVSYGESNPMCQEHTRECWSKNRRVDFKLIP